MIAILTLEIEIKSVLGNTIRKLPVTIEKIRNKTEIDISQRKKKRQINDQQYKKIDGKKIFSICDGILMYGEQVVISGVLQKRIFKDLPYCLPRYIDDENFNEKLYFLAEYGQRNGRKCKILLGLCDSSKGTTSEIYPLDKDGQTLFKATQVQGKDNIFFSGWQFLEMAWDEAPLCSGTIRFLHELFSRFGIPNTIVLDNGAQFSTKEFKEFGKAFSIVYTTTTLYHLRSNGQAEKFVDTFKRGLKKSDENEFVNDKISESIPSDTEPRY